MSSQDREQAASSSSYPSEQSMSQPNSLTQLEHSRVSTMYGRAFSDRILSNKKVRKRLRQIQQIQEYQAALTAMRGRKDKKFHNPFERQLLCTRTMHLLKSVEDCFVRDRNVDWVLKSLGLKNQRLLFKGGVRANLSFVLMYLREDLLPAWLVSRHRLMMAANRKQFAFNVLSLLRSMSSAKSTCLRGTAYDRSQQKKDDSR